MTKTKKKSQVVNVVHQGSFCDCVAQWLFKQKKTLLNFYHSTNIEQEKLYFAFVELKEKRVLCWNSPEANSIRSFVRERGKHYARKGVNEVMTINQAPIIKISLPKPKAYETLPNKQKKEDK